MILRKLTVYFVSVVRPPPKRTHHVAREAGKRTGRGGTARSRAFRSALKLFLPNDKYIFCLLCLTVRRFRNDVEL